MYKIKYVSSANGKKKNILFKIPFQSQLIVLNKFKHYKLIVLCKGNKINGFERN